MQWNKSIVQFFMQRCSIGHFFEKFPPLITMYDSPIYSRIVNSFFKTFFNSKKKRMETIEGIKQQLQKTEVKYEEAKNNLNELEGKLERREWGNDEELKELWKERRSRLIKDLEESKKRR